MDKAHILAALQACKDKAGVAPHNIFLRAGLRPAGYWDWQRDPEGIDERRLQLLRGGVEAIIAELTKIKDAIDRVSGQDVHTAP